jgi:arylsulfatase A-like enzyme
MGEHDLYWERDLYDPTLLVPLVIRAPDMPARSIEAQVRHVDILPTLLELTGRPPLAGADGKSLVALMRGETTESPGPAVSQIHVDPGIYSRPAASLRHDGYKLIKRGAGWPNRSQDVYVGPSTELYDLGADPGERVDLASSNMTTRHRMEDMLRERISEAAPARSGDPEHSRAVQEKLRALGYVD